MSSGLTQDECKVLLSCPLHSWIYLSETDIFSRKEGLVFRFLVISTLRTLRKTKTQESVDRVIVCFISINQRPTKKNFFSCSVHILDICGRSSH